MITDNANTSFSETLASRASSLQASQSVSITGVEVGVTQALANYFAYITHLTMICTVASTTSGAWTLLRSLGGTAALVFVQPEAVAPAGRIYQFPFDMPFKTEAKGALLSILPSVATMGTWRFISNAFFSAT